ncbi:UPF0389 protein CG9231-like [Contarinia nasturtii]|uniref:UPF0389 protein CG9231-like n=1 Tax=Contarinia nasturtii TaxID=265458 RepID=UPI0012D38306|nr:UPF0389 protein CG9231-like [Contarinia nasturtii]
MLRLFTKTALARISHPKLENVRFLSQTKCVFEKTPASSTSNESQSPQTPANQAPTDAAQTQPWQKKSQYRNVTNFDKRVLVSVGKYKSLNDVPDKVPHETLDRARDKFRVKMCIYMMVVCVIFCIVQIIRGKKAAERGESVVNSNMEWHRKYNEEAAKKENK